MTDLRFPNGDTKPSPPGDRPREPGAPRQHAIARVSRPGGRAYLQLVESFRTGAGSPRQRVMRLRLRASESSLAPRRALALLRQIQQHRVLVNQTPYAGTSRMRPEQRDLCKALTLPEPPAKTPRVVAFSGF